MVKVALQLSGRLRFTDDTLSSMLGSIISTIKPDVFCSFWNTEKRETVEEYQRMLSPKLIEFEDHKKVRAYLDVLFPYNKHHNMQSMSYKFNRVSQLRRSYEATNNIKYDVVIQARSDNIFFEKLDLERCQLSLDKQAILCCNTEFTPLIDDYVKQPRMVDNFYLGPADLVDRANDTFWTLRSQVMRYVNQNRIHELLTPEIIQTHIWQEAGIKIDTLPGSSEFGCFWYNIDRSDTEWK
jgi:hypothetical protein